MREGLSTNRVEAGISDGLEVGKRDPRIPVLLENISRIWYLLAKRVLVDDTLLGLKYGRCNPSVLLHLASG